MHYNAHEQTRRRALLAGLGSSVHQRRMNLGLTMKALAEKANVSMRFLVQVESGEGNISVARLADLADALDTTGAELLAQAQSSKPGPKTQASSPGIVSLLGLRGAGKSTLGALVAKRLKVPFVELDKLVAREAGMSLATIWEMHGEAYFRRIEHAALKKFLDQTDEAVLATGGSLVMHKESFDLLRDRATTTIWLKATPKDHWERVVAQGDGRPMKDRPAAMTELRALLRERRPFYAQASQVIDTSSLGLEAAADAVVQAAARRVRS